MPLVGHALAIAAAAALCSNGHSGRRLHSTMRDLPRAHICPSCFSEDVARIPRDRVHDRKATLLRWLGWRMYRCSECGERFYDRRLSPTRTA
jgi:YgiT-type zinc finger domain-containing protein